MKLTDAQAAEVGLQPGPGIYLNVLFSDYLSWPYLSKSALHDFAKSPALHYLRVTGKLPYKATASQIMGTATDRFWVERREDITDILALPPEGMPKSGKKRDEWIASLSPGVEPITIGQWLTSRRMATALSRNKRAMELRKSAIAQVSAVWRHPATGLMLKMRADLVDPIRHVLSDLKTTRSIATHRFDGDVSEYNYHWQLWLYTQALVENGCGSYDDWAHWLITVANQRPHGVACRPMGAIPLELARQETDYHLRRWVQCYRDNHWPADLLDEKPIELPRWRYSKGGLNDDSGQID